MVAAVLTTAPLAVAASLWVGAGSIGAGIRSGAPTYVVAGAVIAAVAAVIVALWASIPGVIFGRRSAQVVALTASIMLLLISLTSAWPTVTAPWAPRYAVTLATAASAVTLAITLIRRSLQPDRRLVGIGLAAAGLIVTYVAVGVVTAAVSTSIPQFPRPPWVSGLTLDALTAPSLTADNPPPLGLAPGEWSSIHNDAWMTDAYRSALLPDPASSEVSSFFAGGDCASLLWNDEGNLIAVCVSPTRVRGFVLDSRTLTPLHQRTLGERPLAADALTNFSGGGYAVLDDEQRVVTPLSGGLIARFDGGDLTPIDRFDVTGSLQPQEQITSVLPDGSGSLWFVGRTGTVGLLDPRTGTARSLVAGSSSQPVDIENSFAVASVGVAYVVTGEQLLRIDNVAGTPEVMWRWTYDRGERRKPGQTSASSGTTPTVFANGDFVAITDNAEPRMNVVVVDVRQQEPREHCLVPVFGDGVSATENSIIAMSRSLFVENNYGYSVTAVAGGRTTVPGLARIDVDETGCSTAWESATLSIPSLVSKGVTDSGAILTYTKDADLLGADAWWFTAVDAGTGQVMWRKLAGIGPLLNNHYAAGYLGPDGSVVVGTISGIVSLRSVG